MPAKGQRISPLERFWRHVDKRGDEECWQWTGARSRKGYGWFRLDPAGEPMGAHRAAYVLLVGPIPDGLHVCHRCDNPPCCNPQHLFLGTNQENALDSWAKGRRRSTGHLRGGEKHYRAQFTNAQVRAVRRRYQPGYGNIAQLAREYGVSRKCMQKIIKGETYREEQ